MNNAQRLNSPDYLRIDIGSSPRFRMMRLKDRVIGHNINRPPSTSWATWRDARQYGFHNWAESYSALSQGFNTEARWSGGNVTEVKTPVWYCHTGEHFRNECDAHDVEDIRMDHTGWCADPDGDTLYIAIVGQLTHGRWISGYRNSDGGERVYFPKVFSGDDAAKEAAYHGDSIAERLAEVEREYQKKRQEAGELAGEIEQGEEGIARLYALRNHPELGQDCRDELTLDITVLRNLREKMETEYSEFKGEF